MRVAQVPRSDVMRTTPPAAARQCVKVIKVGRKSGRGTKACNTVLPGPVKHHTPTTAKITPVHYTKNVKLINK